MSNKHGIRHEEWNNAKDQAKKILIGVARRRGRIAYSELIQQIESVNFEPHDARLFDFLGEISKEEEAAGRGMLTAIVVHKSGDMQPGPGFLN